ncbi:hypothetical protein SSP24_62400 [Streptomyces spinoverrucosus]|uniref:Uncharacterized protein n=1 Tax=Streptomyces spinoverrucosus TaxID=284043 RepID=A0A4Y3VRC4_9ACTN|nr:hypothetical protein SSP24_62400 [Streptomyces spinoverrucosus]GHB69027.1 hypothetical protein GCM10010397_44220 [Streptomyces spinoverrucosus]
MPNHDAASQVAPKKPRRAAHVHVTKPLPDGYAHLDTPVTARPHSIQATHPMSVPCDFCCGGRDALGSRAVKLLQPRTAANSYAWLGWPVCRT